MKIIFYMLDYLELLEVVGGGIYKKTLDEKMGNESDTDRFVNRAYLNHHIEYAQERVTYRSKGALLQLSPEGRLYIKKEKLLYNKWYKKPEWWGIILSGVIGALGLIIALIK
ncbi:MAG: hypothetical protein HY367_01605 [Candidatus Aenigmarchaeota archaeon]|nr:hypothetical protein [Candidatus Aenigmarchaeota archaeon]